MLVVPKDLSLEQSIGIFVIGNFFVGQETDESFLEGIEASLDFAFSRGIGGDAMGGSQVGKGPLKLGMSIQAVGW